MIGENFVDVVDEMLCRVTFSADDSVELPATYVNNHTLACNFPQPPESVALPFGAVVEVSFNLGQQYTVSGLPFYYTPEDSVERIYPTEGFIMGNVKVKVYTSYFFDKTSADAQCLFSYTSAATG